MTGSSPDWQNWSENINYKPESPYYFMPKNLAELQAVLAKAKEDDAIVRVSGQRHSQPPLVISSNPARTTYLVDMACYADEATNNQRMLVVSESPPQVIVNPGVREDELDAFLTNNSLMLKTVTAGGFFSLGGMTAVDVHGGTVNEGIFAETVSSFTIIKADGSQKTIAASPDIDFARVSLGGIGIVTSMTLEALERQYKDTLIGSVDFVPWATDEFNEDGFTQTFSALLAQYQQGGRLEVFFNPYAAQLDKHFLALGWQRNSMPVTPLSPEQPYDTCTSADGGEGDFGADYIKDQDLAIGAAVIAQEAGNSLEAALITGTAMLATKGWAEEANAAFSDLWLTQATRVMFMSYFIELPTLDAVGLRRAWLGLNKVAELVKGNGQEFYIAAPMEFRFIKGGSTAMSGTFTSNPGNTYFVNLDLIGFVPGNGAAYSDALLNFFAKVERYWFETLNGIPHHGKMYGFYDPSLDGESFSPEPFNPNFLEKLRERRSKFPEFKTFCKQEDPDGRFYNEYLQLLLGA
ncbi:MAG: FAD-binding protein [Cyanothece sp. SIO2G6]|nr:FAD-binding protein [Cyanothece sp. SIO2G6]